MPTRCAFMGGQDIRRDLPVNSKTPGTGREVKSVNIWYHMEAHWQNSPHTHRHNMVSEDTPLTEFSYMGENFVRQPSTGRDVQDGHIISHFLQPNYLKEAWTLVKGWYQDSSNWHQNLAQITITHITTDQVSLYQKVLPPLSENIRVSVAPFQVNDLILE